jgi:hypothetical protein
VQAENNPTSASLSSEEEAAATEGEQTEERSDYKGSFHTHRQYLSALTSTIRQHYGGRALFIAPYKVSAGLVSAFREIQPELGLQQRRVDEAALRRVLMSAWGTEFMLWSSGQMASDEEQESLALANQWGVVQAYYACAYVAQALAIAKGNPRPDSHPKTQNLFVHLWVDSYRMFPPWSLAVDSSGILNVPSGIAIEKVHPWAGIDGRTCWSLDALVLSSTRRQVLEERVVRRKLELQAAKRRAFRTEQAARNAAGRRILKDREFAKPRLTGDDRRSLDRGMRATSVLDYLYRLRIRSHYDDPGVFFEGPEDASDAGALHRDLKSLISWTFLLHELLVVELAGKDAFQRTVDGWFKNPVAASAGFGLRRRLDWLL